MQRSTILIVEDDPMQRADTITTLEDAGLRVVDKADADEALGFLLENSTDIAAVLTRHWPHIGVFVTSGRMRPLRDLPSSVHFIPKPWRADQIVEAMQTLVEAD